jgi:hypothetical protein
MYQELNGTQKYNLIKFLHFYYAFVIFLWVVFELLMSFLPILYLMIYLSNLGVCLQLKAISYHVVFIGDQKQIQLYNRFLGLFFLTFVIAFINGIPFDT